ncbi:MAG: helix-turn-helix domain-containing protein, partial [Pseudomonadota bacterium]
MKAKRTNYHHGDLRADLVEATRRLVEEKGPDRFSVSDACRAAGVSTAAPYRHFEDRDEMLLAVCAEGME